MKIFNFHKSFSLSLLNAAVQILLASASFVPCDLNKDNEVEKRRPCQVNGQTLQNHQYCVNQIQDNFELFVSTTGNGIGNRGSCRQVRVEGYYLVKETTNEDATFNEITNDLITVYDTTNDELTGSIIHCDNYGLCEDLSASFNKPGVFSFINHGEGSSFERPKENSVIVCQSQGETENENDESMKKVRKRRRRLSGKKRSVNDEVEEDVGVTAKTTCQVMPKSEEKTYYLDYFDPTALRKIIICDKYSCITQEDETYMYYLDSANPKNVIDCTGSQCVSRLATSGYYKDATSTEEEKRIISCTPNGNKSILVPQGECNKRNSGKMFKRDNKVMICINGLTGKSEEFDIDTNVNRRRRGRSFDFDSSNERREEPTPPTSKYYFVPVVADENSPLNEGDTYDVEINAIIQVTGSEVKQIIGEKPNEYIVISDSSEELIPNNVANKEFDIGISSPERALLYIWKIKDGEKYYEWHEVEDCPDTNDNIITKDKLVTELYDHSTAGYDLKCKNTFKEGYYLKTEKLYECVDEAPCKIVEYPDDGYYLNIASTTTNDSENAKKIINCSGYVKSSKKGICEVATPSEAGPVFSPSASDPANLGLGNVYYDINTNSKGIIISTGKSDDTPVSLPNTGPFTRKRATSYQFSVDVPGYAYVEVPASGAATAFNFPGIANTATNIMVKLTHISITRQKTSGAYLLGASYKKASTASSIEVSNIITMESGLFICENNICRSEKENVSSGYYIDAISSGNIVGCKYNKENGIFICSSKVPTDSEPILSDCTNAAAGNICKDGTDFKFVTINTQIALNADNKGKLISEKVTSTNFAGGYYCTDSAKCTDSSAEIDILVKITDYSAVQYINKGYVIIGQAETNLNKPVSDEIEIADGTASLNYVLDGYNTKIDDKNPGYFLDSYHAPNVITCKLDADSKYKCKSEAPAADTDCVAAKDHGKIVTGGLCIIGGTAGSGQKIGAFAEDKHYFVEDADAFPGMTSSNVNNVVIMSDEYKMIQKKIDYGTLVIQTAGTDIDELVNVDGSGKTLGTDDGNVMVLLCSSNNCNKITNPDEGKTHYYYDVSATAAKVIAVATDTAVTTVKKESKNNLNFYLDQGAFSATTTNYSRLIKADDGSVTSYSTPTDGYYLNSGVENGVITCASNTCQSATLATVDGNYYYLDQGSFVEKYIKMIKCIISSTAAATCSLIAVPVMDTGVVAGNYYYLNYGANNASLIKCTVATGTLTEFNVCETASNEGYYVNADNEKSILKCVASTSSCSIISDGLAENTYYLNQDTVNDSSKYSSLIQCKTPPPAPTEPRSESTSESDEAAAEASETSSTATLNRKGRSVKYEEDDDEEEDDDSEYETDSEYEDDDEEEDDEDGETTTTAASKLKERVDITIVCKAIKGTEINNGYYMNKGDETDNVLITCETGTGDAKTCTGGKSTDAETAHKFYIDNAYLDSTTSISSQLIYCTGVSACVSIKKDTEYSTTSRPITVGTYLNAGVTDSLTNALIECTSTDSCKLINGAGGYGSDIRQLYLDQDLVGDSVTSESKTSNIIECVNEGTKCTSAQAEDEGYYLCRSCVDAKKIIMCNYNSGATAMECSNPANTEANDPIYADNTDINAGNVYYDDTGLINIKIDSSTTLKSSSFSSVTGYAYIEVSSAAGTVNFPGIATGKTQKIIVEITTNSITRVYSSYPNKYIVINNSYYYLHNVSSSSFNPFDGEVTIYKSTETPTHTGKYGEYESVTECPNSGGEMDSVHGTVESIIGCKIEFSGYCISGNKLHYVTGATSCTDNPRSYVGYFKDAERSGYYITCKSTGCTSGVPPTVDVTTGCAAGKLVTDSSNNAVKVCTSTNEAATFGSKYLSIAGVGIDGTFLINEDFASSIVTKTKDVLLKVDSDSMIQQRDYGIMAISSTSSAVDSFSSSITIGSGGEVTLYGCNEGSCTTITSCTKDGLFYSYNSKFLVQCTGNNAIQSFTSITGNSLLDDASITKYGGKVFYLDEQSLVTAGGYSRVILHKGTNDGFAFTNNGGKVHDGVTYDETNTYTYATGGTFSINAYKYYLEQDKKQMFSCTSDLNNILNCKLTTYTATAKQYHYYFNEANVIDSQAGTYGGLIKCDVETDGTSASNCDHIDFSLITADTYYLGDTLNTSNAVVKVLIKCSTPTNGSTVCQQIKHEVNGKYYYLNDGNKKDGKYMGLIQCVKNGDTETCSDLPASASSAGFYVNQPDKKKVIQCLDTVENGDAAHCLAITGAENNYYLDQKSVLTQATIGNHNNVIPYTQIIRCGSSSCENAKSESVGYYINAGKLDSTDNTDILIKCVTDAADEDKVKCFGTSTAENTYYLDQGKMSDGTTSNLIHCSTTSNCALINGETTKNVVEGVYLNAGKDSSNLVLIKCYIVPTTYGYEDDNGYMQDSGIVVNVATCFGINATGVTISETTYKSYQGYYLNAGKSTADDKLIYCDGNETQTCNAAAGENKGIYLNTEKIDTTETPSPDSIENYAFTGIIKCDTSSCSAATTVLPGYYINSDATTTPTNRLIYCTSSKKCKSLESMGTNEKPSYYANQGVLSKTTTSYTSLIKCDIDGESKKRCTALEQTGVEGQATITKGYYMNNEDGGAKTDEASALFECTGTTLTCTSKLFADLASGYYFNAGKSTLADQKDEIIVCLSSACTIDVTHVIKDGSKLTVVGNAKYNNGIEILIKTDTTKSTASFSTSTGYLLLEDILTLNDFPGVDTGKDAIVKIDAISITKQTISGKVGSGTNVYIVLNRNYIPFDLSSEKTIDIGVLRGDIIIECETVDTCAIMDKCPSNNGFNSISNFEKNIHPNSVSGHTCAESSGLPTCTNSESVCTFVAPTSPRAAKSFCIDVSDKSNNKIYQIENAITTDDTSGECKLFEITGNLFIIEEEYTQNLGGDGEDTNIAYYCKNAGTECQTISGSDGRNYVNTKFPEETILEKALMLYNSGTSKFVPKLATKGFYEDAVDNDNQIIQCFGETGVYCKVIEITDNDIGYYIHNDGAVDSNTNALIECTLPSADVICTPHTPYIGYYLNKGSDVNTTGEEIIVCDESGCKVGKSGKAPILSERYSNGNAYYSNKNVRIVIDATKDETLSPSEFLNVVSYAYIEVTSTTGVTNFPGITGGTSKNIIVKLKGNSIVLVKADESRKYIVIDDGYEILRSYDINLSIGSKHEFYEYTGDNNFKRLFNCPSPLTHGLFNNDQGYSSRNTITCKKIIKSYCIQPSDTDKPYEGKLYKATKESVNKCGDTDYDLVTVPGYFVSAEYENHIITLSNTSGEGAKSALPATETDCTQTTNYGKLVKISDTLTLCGPEKIKVFSSDTKIYTDKFVNGDAANGFPSVTDTTNPIYVKFAKDSITLISGPGYLFFTSSNEISSTSTKVSTVGADGATAYLLKFTGTTFTDATDDLVAGYYKDASAFLDTDTHVITCISSSGDISCKSSKTEAVDTDCNETNNNGKMTSTGLCIDGNAKKVQTFTAGETYYGFTVSILDYFPGAAATSQILVKVTELTMTQIKDYGVYIVDNGASATNTLVTLTTGDAERVISATAADTNVILYSCKGDGNCISETRTNEGEVYYYEHSSKIVKVTYDANAVVKVALMSYTAVDVGTNYYLDQGSFTTPNYSRLIIVDVAAENVATVASKEKPDAGYYLNAGIATKGVIKCSGITCINQDLTVDATELNHFFPERPSANLDTDETTILSYANLIQCNVNSDPISCTVITVPSGTEAAGEVYYYLDRGTHTDSEYRNVLKCTTAGEATPFTMTCVETAATSMAATIGEVKYPGYVINAGNAASVIKCITTKCEFVAGSEKAYYLDQDKFTDNSYSKLIQCTDTECQTFVPLAGYYINSGHDASTTLIGDILIQCESATSCVAAASLYVDTTELATGNQIKYLLNNAYVTEITPATDPKTYQWSHLIYCNSASACKDMSKDGLTGESGVSAKSAYLMAGYYLNAGSVLTGEENNVLIECTSDDVCVKATTTIVEGSNNYYLDNQGVVFKTTGNEIDYYNSLIRCTSSTVCAAVVGDPANTFGHSYEVVTGTYINAGNASGGDKPIINCLVYPSYYSKCVSAASTASADVTTYYVNADKHVSKQTIQFNGLIRCTTASCEAINGQSANPVLEGYYLNSIANDSIIGTHYSNVYSNIVYCYYADTNSVITCVLSSKPPAAPLTGSTDNAKIGNAHYDSTLKMRIVVASGTLLPTTNAGQTKPLYAYIAVSKLSSGFNFPGVAEGDSGYESFIVKITPNAITRVLGYDTCVPDTDSKCKLTGGGSLAQNQLCIYGQEIYIGTSANKDSGDGSCEVITSGGKITSCNLTGAACTLGSDILQKTDGSYCITNENKIYKKITNEECEVADNEVNYLAIVTETNFVVDESNGSGIYELSDNSAKLYEFSPSTLQWKAMNDCPIDKLESCDRYNLNQGCTTGLTCHNTRSGYCLDAAKTLYKTTNDSSTSSCGTPGEYDSVPTPEGYFLDTEKPGNVITCTKGVCESNPITDTECSAKTDNGKVIVDESTGNKIFKLCKDGEKNDKVGFANEGEEIYYPVTIPKDSGEKTFFGKSLSRDSNFLVKATSKDIQQVKGYGVIAVNNENNDNNEGKKRNALDTEVAFANISLYKCFNNEYNECIKEANCGDKYTYYEFTDKKTVMCNGENDKIKAEAGVDGTYYIDEQSVDSNKYTIIIKGSASTPSAILLSGAAYNGDISTATENVGIPDGYFVNSANAGAFECTSGVCVKLATPNADGDYVYLDRPTATETTKTENENETIVVSYYTNIIICTVDESEMSCSLTTGEASKYYFSADYDGSGSSLGLSLIKCTTAGNCNIYSCENRTEIGGTTNTVCEPTGVTVDGRFNDANTNVKDMKIVIAQ